MQLLCAATAALLVAAVLENGDDARWLAARQALEDGKSVRVQFEKPRLRGSRGSTFVFVRGGNGADDVAPQVEQLYSARALGVASTLALAVTLLVGAFFLGMKVLRCLLAASLQNNKLRGWRVA
eukprot:scaffold502_cov271-Prasinococcus_capsulatus_cf.AAC.3